MATVSRREFLETTAAGACLIIGFSLDGRTRSPMASPTPMNAWLRIGDDDSILIIVDKSEMGQGVTTSLPMLVAEELEADWSKINIEFAPAGVEYVNPMFGMQGTGGSTSIRASWMPLRHAGAAAREVLVEAAANDWGVPREECRAERGAVVHDSTGRRTRYGDLVAAAATLTPPENPTLKDPATFTLIGTPISRLDTPAKVDGSAEFGIDVSVPGMLTAVVARCPVFGGRVASFDAAAARAVTGVRDVVEISGGIAVVADGYWPAKKGRDALRVTWEEGANASVSDASIAQMFARSADRAGAVGRHEGDPDGVLSSGGGLEAVYELPFLAHATMEPLNCTAHVRPDGVDIWAPTQFQTGAQQLGADIGGVPADQVRIHTTYLGGGFGRRFEMDVIQEALEVSRAVGAPAKVIWSREDDTQHDFYRPASYHRMRARLDGSRRPVAWTHRIVAPSIMARLFPDQIQNGLDPESVEGAIAMPYAIPNVHVDYLLSDTGVPVGFWRSVNNSFNAFAVEGFIDELAHAAGRDPYEFRRDLLANAPRHLGVLNLAARESGWGSAAQAGRSRGIAVFESFGTFVAQVAEVSVAADGTVRVHRVTCAIDCGPVVNPSIVEAQMESCIVYGLTAALYGEIHIDGGRARESNFHDYPMVRMADMPVVDVHIVASTDSVGGVGEPGTPPIAPAVCNAIFAATGQRIRKLPIGKVAVG